MQEFDNPIWQQAFLETQHFSEQSALKQSRQEAWEVFSKTGFPDRHNENWKYTNISEIVKQNFSFGIKEFKKNNIEKYKLENAYCLVFINGKFSESNSNLTGLPKGVSLKLFAKSSSEEQFFASIDQKNKSIFADLNAALFSTGFVLEIEKEVKIEKPVHILYINTESGSQSIYMSHARHVIVAGENAQFTLFEEYVSEGEHTYFNNIVTQVNAAAGAKIQHYKLQRESKQAFHISNILFQQEKDSVVNSYHFALGSKIAREDLNFSLQQSGSEATLLGFYHPRDGQHIDMHSCIDHSVPHTTSRQNYKGIIQGKSRAVFNGKVMVHPKAQQTVAHQSNKNLLLSKNAEIDTKPELEIYADDVQCSHGATIGELDKKALFYLRSRGIEASMARHLLTCAFAAEITEQLPVGVIADRIQASVVKRLAIQDCEKGCVHE